MLYNKREVRKVNDKKVLHKVKKQWVVLSAFALALLGAGVIATTNVQADPVSANNEQPKTSNVTPSGKKPSTQPTKQNTQSIMKQAKQMTSTLMANAGQKANHAQSASANQTKPSAASSGNKAVSSVAPSKNATSSTSNSAKQVVSNLASGSKQRATNGPSSVANNGQTSQNDKAASSSNSASNGNAMTTVQAKPGLLRDINPKMNLTLENPVNQNDKWIYDPSTQKYVSDDQVRDWTTTYSDNTKNDVYNGLNYKYSPSTHAVEFINGVANSDLSSFLANASDSDGDLSNLQSIKFDNGTDFSHVTNMSDMLNSDSNLKSLVLPNNMNTDNVTNMNSMFSSDTSLSKLILPVTFNTEKALSNSNMLLMFSNDNKLRLTIQSSNTKFNNDIYSNLEAKNVENSDIVNIKDSSSHTGTYQLFTPQKVNITVNFYTDNNGTKTSINNSTQRLNGLEGSSDIVTPPNGYNFVNNDSDVTYKSNGAYDLQVTPYYDGMFYKVNPDESVEFTNGTLRMNNDGNGFINTNTPSNIKYAPTITFDSDIDSSNISDFDNMFASDGYLHNVSLNFATRNSDSMKKLLASDVNLQTVSFGKKFKTTSFNHSADDMNSDNDSNMFINDDNLEQINNQSSDIHFNSKANVPTLYLQLSSKDKDNRPYTSLNSVDTTNLPKGTLLKVSHSAPQTYKKGIEFVNKNQNTNNVPLPEDSITKKGTQGTSYTLKASDIPLGFALDNISSDSIEFNDSNLSQIKPIQVYVHPQYDGMNYMYSKDNNAITFTDGSANTSLSDFIQNSPDVIKNAKTLTFNNKINFNNVSSMNNMFANDSDVKEINLDVGTNSVYNMDNLFNNDSKLNKVSLGNKFSTANADTTGLFNGDNKLQNIDINSSDFQLDPSENIGTTSLSISNVYSSNSKNPYLVLDNSGEPVNLNDGNIHQGNFSRIINSYKAPSNGTYNGLNYTYDSTNNAITFTGGKPNQSSVSNFVNNLACQLFMKKAHIITFNSDVNFNKVTDMSNMLSNDPNLTEVNFENYTNKVTNMKDMFANDPKLRNVLFGYNFSTQSVNDVSDMNGMFSNDLNLKQIINASPNTIFKGDLGTSPIPASTQDSQPTEAHMLGASQNATKTPFIMRNESNSPQSDLTDLADGKNHQGIYLKSGMESDGTQTPYNLQPSRWPNLEKDPTAYTKPTYRNIPDAVYNPEWGKTHNSDASIHIFYTYNSDFKRAQPLQWSDMPTQYQPKNMLNRSKDDYKIIGTYDHYTGEHHNGFGSQGVIGYQLAIGVGPSHPFGNELLRFTPKNIQGYIFHPSSDEINNSFDPYNTQAYSESDGSNGFKEHNWELTSQTNPYLPSNQDGDAYILDYDPTAKGNQFNLDHDTLDITLNYENYRDTIKYSYTNPKNNKTYYWSDLNSDSRNDKNVNSDYDHPFANFYNDVKNHGTFDNIPTSTDFPYGLYVTPSDKDRFLNSVDTSFQYGRNHIVIPLSMPSTITVNYIKYGQYPSMNNQSDNYNGESNENKVVGGYTTNPEEANTPFTDNIEQNIPSGYTLLNNNYDHIKTFTSNHQVINVPVINNSDNTVTYTDEKGNPINTYAESGEHYFSDYDLQNNFRKALTNYNWNTPQTDYYKLHFIYHLPSGYRIDFDNPEAKQALNTLQHSNFDYGKVHVKLPIYPVGTIKVNYITKDKNGNNQLVKSTPVTTQKPGTPFKIDDYLDTIPNGYEYAGISIAKDIFGNVVNPQFDYTKYDRSDHIINILLTKIPSRKQVTQSTITVNYLDKSNHDKFISKAGSDTETDGTNFDIVKYLSNLPNGYEYAGVKTPTLDENFDGTFFDNKNHTIDVLLTKVSTTPKIAQSTITVNYLDKVTGQPVAKSKSDTENVSTDFDIGDYLNQLPSGYEYAGIKNANGNDNFNGTEFDYNNHMIDVLLTKAPKPKVAQSTITVNYLDKATGQQVSPSKLDTENVSTNFDIKNYLNNLPQGYKYNGVRNNVDHFDYDNHTVDVLLNKVTPHSSSSSESNNPSGTAGLPPFTPMNPIAPTGNSTNSAQNSASSSASGTGAAKSSQNTSRAASSTTSKHKAKAADQKPTRAKINHDIKDHHVTPSDSTHMTKKQMNRVKKNNRKEYSKIVQVRKQAKDRRAAKINKDIKSGNLTSSDVKQMTPKQWRRTKRTSPKTYRKAVRIQTKSNVKSARKQLREFKKTNPKSYRQVVRSSAKLARQVNNLKPSRMSRNVIQRIASTATPQQLNYLAVHNPKAYQKIMAEQDLLGISHIVSGHQSIARMARTMTPRQLAYLAAHNPKLYRKVLAEQDLLGISHVANSRADANAYVNGIDDARLGLLAKSHNSQYLKGYNAFKKANGNKLPQTGEAHGHLSLAAAVLMVLSLTFSLPVLKRKRHDE